MKSARLTAQLLESRIVPSTFTVTTINDSGTGSLRDALAQADAHPGHDNIVFNMPGVNVISLQNGELTSTGNVTISGPGAGKLTIDAQNASAALDIDDGSGNTDSPTTISGLSVIRGNVFGVLSHESVALKNVVISDCVGVGLEVVGNSNSAVTTASISGSLICDNYGSGGVDLRYMKAFSISRTAVDSNANRGSSGGGIIALLSQGGTAGAIDDCTIAANEADVEGGGLEVVNESSVGRIAINDCTIVNNFANIPGDRGGGGGVLSSGRVTVDDSIICNNSGGYYGGGIEMLGDGAPLKISNCTITGNQTTLQSGSVGEGGGGIAVFGDGSSTTSVTISGSHIADNHSVHQGGGIIASGGLAVTIANSNITGNTAATEGGGIYSTGLGANIVNLTINGGSFAGNSAAWDSAAILAFGDGALSMSGTKVTGNVAPTFGGAITIDTTGAVTIKGLVATGNAGYFGGALDIVETPNFEIIGGRITNNSAYEGGGIRIVDSSGSIRGVTISGNTATNSGGGLFKSGTGAVTLQIEKVTGNTALEDAQEYGTFTIV